MKSRIKTRLLFKFRRSNMGWGGGGTITPGHSTCTAVT